MRSKRRTARLKADSSPHRGVSSPSPDLPVADIEILRRRWIFDLLDAPRITVIDDNNYYRQPSPRMLGEARMRLAAIHNPDARSAVLWILYKSLAQRLSKGPPALGFSVAVPCSEVPQSTTKETA